MPKDYGDSHSETPAILMPIDSDSLAHALKQKRDGEQYSVFGTNVKKVFAGLTPEDGTRVLIRMSHPGLAPGEEAVADYLGILDQVWLDPPETQNNKDFFWQFQEIFKSSWLEIKCGAGKWQEGPWPVYFGLKQIRYLRSPIRVSELRNWSDGTFFVANYRVRRPTRIIWEQEFLQRIGA